jgi:pyridoxine 5-phosphate synthase
MQDLRLHVNVDHVATLRQARRTKYPDPVFAAYLCESVGAAGITVHLREDRRHIQERDVYLLRESVQGILNLEMGASPELINFACELRPDLVTLVPERREELTTEGGLDVVGLGESLQQAIQTLQNAGVPVSLFVAPDSAQVEASHRAGVRGIELHTGHYCEVTGAERQQELARLAAASKQAAALGLEVAAGHGLTCENVSPICHLPEVVELNIGHGIVSRAVFVGMERAVQEMLEVMRRERIHAQKR